MSREVEKLEHRFAAAFGYAGAVAAGFGRSALVLALEAMEVRGGEVLVPDFICSQVTQAVRRAGATPVCFRVEHNLSVDAGAFRASFGPRVKAAVVAHYFGHALGAVPALKEICHERRIPLIEDCALAFGVPGAGRHGEAAVFSFTKSDWCYGGGLLASHSAALLERAAEVRRMKFSSGTSLALRYGLLRRADFGANRPSLSRAAAYGGRVLERMSRLGENNFFDAGRFDHRISIPGARRALRLVESRHADSARRRPILAQLWSSLRGGSHILVGQPPEANDAATFLVLRSAAGNARRWVERAGQDGVTLRLCWPAYQDAEPAQASSSLEWFGEHLLFMEIHPRLTGREVARIARCLRKLADTE